MVSSFIAELIDSDLSVEFCFFAMESGKEN